jgi:hypothetical protein
MQAMYPDPILKKYSRRFSTINKVSITYIWYGKKINV